MESAPIAAPEGHAAGMRGGNPSAERYGWRERGAAPPLSRGEWIIAAAVIVAGVQPLLTLASMIGRLLAAH